MGEFSEEWTGKAMVCVKDGGWVVVDPGLRNAGTGGEGGFLSLMNDARGTGMEQCVRYNREGIFFLGVVPRLVHSKITDCVTRGVTHVGLCNALHTLGRNREEVQD